MSDNAKHLAKKCVKDAGPCLALCVAGAAVALLAVLGPFDVLDLIFWVFDPFGWKSEG